MAVARDRPYTQFNFLVDLGDGSSAGPQAGFQEVSAIATWTHGRTTLLGDAAHPLLQYLAQGACMALEDAVTLGRALAATGDDIDAAFALYQHSRVARTARVVLMTREMGRIYHAQGVERLVRNDLWKGRSPARFYDALEWLYGWTAERCLAA